MQLLTEAAGSTPGRLCVLGAGNCNDVDLVRLNKIFTEIVLMDIDRSAMEAAVSLHVPESERRCFQIAEAFDVTGILERLQANDAKEEGSSAGRDVMTLLSGEPPMVPHSPFDCVLSGCLLSQMIDSVNLSLGANHPLFVPIVLALRRQHLKSLVQCLAIGGRGVLVFDFVSSQSLPGLMRLEESRLGQALFEAIQAKNFFTGLNPFAVQAELQSHADFVGRVTDVRLHSPWRWDIGVKQFAVSAISFTRL